MKHSILNTLAAAVLLTCPATMFASEASVPDQPTKNIDMAIHPNYTGDDMSKVLNGRWTIVAVGKTKIEREENEPYITFVPDESAFYASNGCNILNGAYTVDGRTLSFHNVLSTMRYCKDTPWDGQINSVLADGSSVTVKYGKVGNEGYVYMTDKAGKGVMTLRRHAMDFLNGNWQIVEINGERVDDDEATIFFDIEELAAHGNTGCNYFNGKILVDPQAANAISFSNMGVTRRGCPKADQERRILVALEEAATAFDGGNGTALLTSADSKSIIKLKRIPITGVEN